MKDIRLKKIEKHIKKIKKKLASVGEMRPGSLSQQNREKKKEKYGSYCHLSYTHKGMGHTEYIKKISIKDVKKQIVNYQLFKKLMDRWISLAIKHSQIKMKMADK